MIHQNMNYGFRKKLRGIAPKFFVSLYIYFFNPRYHTAPSWIWTAGNRLIIHRRSSSDHHICNEEVNRIRPLNRRQIHPEREDNKHLQVYETIRPDPRLIYMNHNRILLHISFARDSNINLPQHENREDAVF